MRAAGVVATPTPIVVEVVEDVDVLAQAPAVIATPHVHAVRTNTFMERAR
jgi:hypothetical protein